MWESKVFGTYPFVDFSFDTSFLSTKHSESDKFRQGICRIQFYASPHLSCLRSLIFLNRLLADGLAFLIHS